MRYIPGHQRWAHRNIPEGFRWCNGHQALTPIVDFYSTPERDGQLSGTCKECRRKAARDPKRQRATKGRKLKQHFGLSIDTYESMLKEQHGVCAICKRPERQKHQSGKVKDLAVDHDHTNGKVRGLLCYACNHLLGNAEDDILRLQSAIEYLLRARP